jgi:CHASE3 domain sensor protein
MAPGRTPELPSLAHPPTVLPAWAARAPLLAGLLMLLALGCGAWNWVAVSRDRVAIDAAHDGVLQAEGLLSALKDAETGQRGFILTGQESFREPLQTGRAAVSARLAALDQAAAAAGLDGPATLRRLAEAQLAWSDEVVALRRSAGLEAAIRAVESGRGKELMDAARAEVARFQREAGGLAASLAAASRGRAAWFYALTLGMALGAALLLGALALWRRNAERRSQGLLQGVMENAPVGLGFLDRRLRLSNANRTLATWSSGRSAWRPAGRWSRCRPGCASSSRRTSRLCWPGAGRSRTSRRPSRRPGARRCATSVWRSSRCGPG